MTIFAQEPKLGPVKAAIRDNAGARCSGCRSDAVNVKAKTGEKRRPHRPRRGHRLPGGRADRTISCRISDRQANRQRSLIATANGASMPLHVYNTLTRKKEPFPKQPGEPVTMYVCGPTVYKPSHIGHMVGPVIFDTVKRYLTYLGYKVTWVVNITDVDDKLIVRASELKHDGARTSPSR